MSVPVKRRVERNCCVPGCKVRTSENTVFHKFPSDANRKESWIRACNITTDVTGDSLICGFHFTKDDYISDINSRLRGLKPTAVPRPNATPNLGELNASGSNKQRSPSQSRKKCSVPQCTATDERRSFHTVPKDEKIKKKWVKACGIGIVAHPYAYVCSAHFERADFITGITSRKQVLRLDAFPSLNLPDKRPVMRTFGPNKAIQKDKPRPAVVDSSILEEEEKVTTIIYVPESCTANIINQSGTGLPNQKFVIPPDNLSLCNSNVFPQVQNSVATTNVSDTHVQGRSSSTPKIAIVKDQSRTGLPNQKFVISSDNLNLCNSNVFPQVQNSVATTNVSDTHVQGRSSSTPKVTVIKDSLPSLKQKTPEIKGHTPKTRNVQGKVVVQKELVNTLVNQGNSNNDVSPQTNNLQARVKLDSSPTKKTIIRPGVSAVTLCADCGQYCKIEDEDLLYKSYKNSETLAAELLLELQEINLANEDERILLTRKGIEICNKAIQKEGLDLMELLTNDHELMAFTGINFELLDKLTTLVSNIEGISSAKQNIPAKTRIVLCLCKLRVNVSFACLGMLFGITQQECANKFFSMLKILAVLLEKTIHWPKTEELLKDLPQRFQSFKQTRVILNCSETEIDKQRCSNCQLKLVGGAENRQAVKWVLGVAPSGLIIFKSNVFESQSAHVSVFTQTNIMEKIDPAREAIMADKTLNIEAECAENNVTLIKLPKLGKNKQFSKHDVELIKNISTARIHVDRTLHRFRMYKIMQAKVHWRILPYLDDVCTVIAGIVNMKNPIPPNEIDVKSIGPIRK